MENIDRLSCLISTLIIVFSPRSFFSSTSSALFAKRPDLGTSVRTMGEQFETSSLLLQQTVESKEVQCPCCSFYYSKWKKMDLFLPPGVEPESKKDKDIVMSPLDALRELNFNSDKLPETDALEEGSNRVVSYKIVDSHCHPHLDQERIEEYVEALKTDKHNADINPNVLELSCSVSQKDWISCLEYASKNEPSVVPALGVHPWYVMEGLSDDYLEQLEALLLSHPSALVGEIGLCKCARDVRHHPAGKQAALQKQQEVFVDQMRLAAKLRRPVSVHCVQQMGPMMNILREILEESKASNDKLSFFPPAIAFHSFTGTSEHIKRILELEDTIYDGISESSRRPIMYFGFSHIINYVMCSSEKSARKGRGELFNK